MPVSRMRMRPWLERMIDSESIAGLNWLSKEEGVFAIPWKHAARHGWEMDKDASLFKLWAIHTGKYVEGQTCDPKTWKANFRCAMNSLPDIEEVKGRSINKGHQAVRVFKMLPANTKSRANKHSKARESKSKKKVKRDEDIEYDDTRSPVDQSQLHDISFAQDNRTESTVLSDFSVVASSDVPDWSLSVEIGPDNFSENFSHRFEVSPQESPEHDYDLSELSENLDMTWNMSPLNCIDLLTNNPGYSPGGPWSDSSSGEDSDELPRYTVLGQGLSQPMSDLCSYTKDFLWPDDKMVNNDIERLFQRHMTIPLE